MTASVVFKASCAAAYAFESARGAVSVDPALKRWPMPAPVPRREVGVVWQRATVRAPLVEAVVALAAKNFALA